MTVKSMFILCHLHHLSFRMVILYPAPLQNPPSYRIQCTLHHHFLFTIHSSLTKMASMPCSFKFTSPLFNPSKSNQTHFPSYLSVNSSSIKSSLGSSSSELFQHGFALKAGIFSGFSSVSRSEFGVFARAATGKTIYDFTVKDIDRKDVPLSKFKGKVLLIVNVASQCGLTSSNYSELSQIYNKYKNQGLEILAFPCNQFGFQEPGSNDQIKKFACTRFKAEFPIFDKIDVNGPFTAPIYQFLKSNSGGFLGDLVKWNFEKFLVDKNGKVVERYPPTTSPLQIEKDIKKLLAA